jgi:glucuronoarabinoxylan endo-1,4-beta-xylanase
MKIPLASIVVASALLASAMASAQTATINFNTTFQTIHGFGGAESWMPAFTTAQSNALFGTANNQLGLTILRVRIDPSLTTGGSNWATELANAQAAHSRGALVFATPWTPPAAWKSSNSTVEGVLNPSEYGAFAGYLNAFTAYMAAGGVPLYAISMQNEPDANVTYESCVWTGATMDTWVANNAGALTTKLMMPESESFITGLSDPALNDANAVGKISIIAGHLYGTSPSFYTNAENKGKEVWETEHYLTPSGAQPAIADAIVAAQEFHASMVTGQYNAYVWWWILDWNPGGGVINYGLIDSNSNPTYYGAALAQYSKYVRPGSVRVSATANPVSGVDVSAYTGNGQSEIVAINANGSPSTVTFATSGETLSSVTPFETSASGMLAQQTAVSVSGGAFSYTLPAQSITTFVGTTGSVSPSFMLLPSASTLAVTQGSSATDTISVTDVGGFTGAVSFAATGLPSGVTASFSPTSSATSSVLTLTASSTATVGGPVTVTITGTSGTTIASTTVALTVKALPVSGFSLAPSAPTVPVTQGSSATDTVTVTDTGGFTGSVTFTATGLPSGVTASFSPTASTTSSVLTLTASSTATTGAFTVTITGTSGTTTASTTVTLDVTSSGGGSACTVDYTISPQNTSQFGATVKIINGGTTTLSNWSLTWSFANGQTFASSWNGTVAQSGANVTVSQQAGQTWENIPAGGSYSGFGFNGNWNGVTNAIPTAFSLNGTACTVN